VPLEDDIKPTDPVSENMNILNGEPVKAFIYQDHEAHIQVHMSLTENPEVMQLMSKSPTAKAAQAAMASHIAEHVAFAYRQKIEKELGVKMPAPDEPLPEDIEYRLSQLVAPAAAQVTGKAQQQAQAEQNAKQQQDPVIQMQQKELQLKEQEAMVKAQTAQKDMQIKEQQVFAKTQVDMAKAQAEMVKINADLEKAKDRSALESRKLEQQERLEAAKLASKMSVEQEQSRSREEIAGFKVGFDIVRDMLDDDETGQQ